MKIVEKAIGELKPYENNPRHNGGAVEYVANSIQKFGFKVPIVIDKDGVIVAGHTRLLAAQELGLEKVPCIVADDLNEDQIRAFRLADNKVSELSSWDFDKLDKELAALDFDMTDFGFADRTPADAIDSFFESHEPSAEPAAGHQPKTKTVTCPRCGEEFEIET